jgi:hypothetical protein
VPQWQNGLTFTTILPSGTTSLTGRGVPDVAGNASPFSGYSIIVYGESTLSKPPARANAVGGTSAVGPLYAALMAIIAAQAGWSLGYLNPILYQIGNTPKQKALKLIDDGQNNQLNTSYVLPSGDNATPCTGYVSVSKSPWNACAGWGTIDGKELLKALILLEETRPIDPDIPFSFGAGGEWLYLMNTANIYDCTYVYNNSPNNAVLVADNQSTGNGAVGLFGRSRGSSWSIGVAGECVNGCAVYGIATGEVSQQGIGVVGRSMGGIATETLPLEEVVGEPVGVLGHSANGPGVRGHGGPLLKQPQAGQSLPPAPAAPGGTFSSGRLQNQVLSQIQPLTETTVSLDSRPQLRLIPSVADSLPVIAQVGDLFLVVLRTVDTTGPAHLFVCTGMNPGPLWQEVQFAVGPPLPGGSPI